jgi:RND family efflux transporter MFP subunit
MDERTQLLHSLAIDRTAPRAVRPRRRFLLAILAVAVILAAAGVAIVWQLSTAALPVAAPAPPGPPPAPPPAATAAQSHALVASGYVVARRKATIASEITGKVVELRVDEGNVVEAGQILAQLDSSIAETDLALAQSRALASQAAVGAIAADLRDAERIFDRTRTLSQKNFASEADLTKADAKVGVLRAQLNQSQAQLETARLDAQRAAKVLEQHRIRAPFAGVVIERSAQPGEMISPMSAGGSFTRTGICTIVDMDSIEVEVDVNEAFIGRVHAGGPVTAVLDAYPDWTIPASVIAIVPTANRDKATVKVRIGFATKDPRILPDMGIKVTFLDPDGPGASAAAHPSRPD